MGCRASPTLLSLCKQTGNKRSAPGLRSESVFRLFSTWLAADLTAAFKNCKN
jgi:hypothetical protein